MSAERSNEKIRREYDFSRGERGKYARRYSEGSNVVVLDPDVAKAFKTPEAVNNALRAIAEKEHLTQRD
ncbi:MAG TPA: hypothetical protein VE569_07705 [Acidimicrobiia bacterium]|jgi:hypothetical protein|nr:hypothetical protein [Acidimicrobiia bacterium]